MEYKILETKGWFIVGEMHKKRSLMGLLALKSNGFHAINRFKTLEEARKFLKVITKPDTYHEIQ